MNYRQDFPLLRNYENLVYLDNAATTQKPQSMINAISNYYNKTNANVHRGIYRLSEEATFAYENARSVIANFINAATSEIIFTSGTTAGINLIAQFYFKKQINADSVILLSILEHHSNILPWQQIAKDTDAKLVYIPLNEDLELDIDRFTEILKTEKVAILSLSYIGNVLGNINNLEEIVNIVREISPQTKVVIDAAQALAHLPIDVKRLDCDFLVASAHKAYGPTGIGFIYAKQDILEEAEPFFTGGGMIGEVTEYASTFATGTEKFEAGTPNISGAIGFAAAIEYIKNIGWDAIITHEKALTQQLLQGLENIKSIAVYGSKGHANRAGVISFNMAQVHPHDLAQLLDQEEIALRAGHHCAQILHKKLLKVPASCRASIAIYNDEKDITRLISALKKIEKAGLFG